MRKSAAVLGAMLLLALIPGCSEERAEAPERRAAREMAFRQACIARDLERRSEEDLELLEATLASADPGDPLGSIVAQTTRVALDFSRAFHRHAELRANGSAYLDSAANHAATAADSARYVQRAQAFAIRSPQPGTIEANVLADYQEKLLVALNDSNHRCNWDIPF